MEMAASVLVSVILALWLVFAVGCAIPVVPQLRKEGNIWGIGVILVMLVGMLYGVVSGFICAWLR